MADLIDLHLAAMRPHLSPATLRTRRTVLRSADVAPELECGLAAACGDEITEWLGRPEFFPNTRATYDYHLRAFFRWACEHHLDYDPMVGGRRPPKRRKIPRPIGDTELAVLLAVATGPLLTCLILAAYAGLRCCEIACVRREDITADTLTVLGKGGDEATTATHPIVWRHVEPMTSGLVIVAVGGRADADWVSRSCRRWMRGHGVESSLHRCRDWHATALRRSGADLFVVRAAMRHASIATTQGYAAVGDGESRDAIRRLPDLGQPPVVE